MILFFYNNFLVAISKVVNLTVIGLYFSLETVIFAFYGKFPIRRRMSPYSTNDVRMEFFLGFVSEMESGLKHLSELLLYIATVAFQINLRTFY